MPAVALIPWIGGAVGGFLLGRGADGVSEIVKYGVGGFVVYLAYKAYVK